MRTVQATSAINVEYAAELTSAGYDRQFEVVQEELAAHQLTASAVMQRGLPAQMMIVCAGVIFILMIVCEGEINIPDLQIRQVQANQVDSKRWRTSNNKYPSIPLVASRLGLQTTAGKQCIY
jgi:hypothetical protein